MQRATTRAMMPLCRALTGRADCAIASTKPRLLFRGRAVKAGGSAHREEVNGELGRFRFEFWSWRTARGLEPVAEEAEPHRRASAGARARVRGRGPAAVGA